MAISFLFAALGAVAATRDLPPWSVPCALQTAYFQIIPVRACRVFVHPLWGCGQTPLADFS